MNEASTSRAANAQNMGSTATAVREQSPIANIIDNIIEELEVNETVGRRLIQALSPAIRPIPDEKCVPQSPEAAAKAAAKEAAIAETENRDLSQHEILLKAILNKIRHNNQLLADAQMRSAF